MKILIPRSIFGTPALYQCQSQAGESSPLLGGVIFGNNECHLGQGGGWV